MSLIKPALRGLSRSQIVRLQSTFPKINHAWVQDFSMPDHCPGTEAASSGKALVLGMYGKCDEEGESNMNNVVFTATASKYNDYSCLELFKQLKASSTPLALGESRMFFNVEPSFPITVMVGLGNMCYGYNKIEQRDEAKEAVRIAVGAGCRAAQDLGVGKIYIESFGYTEAAAEGAGLALWLYQDLKNKRKRKVIPHLGLYDDCDWTAWQVGLEKAAAQNLARQLQEAPSNLTTPILFTMMALDELCKTGISAEVRVENWIVENRMDAFLAVAKGSFEQPIFLELVYNGCDPCTPPIVMVGEGITYDSGGLCLKRDANELDLGRGDIGGAASVIATMRSIASMNLPMNVRALIPLCENMPGAGAFKPGDIVRAMNGKNILVENTEFEGQLLLADALSYAQKYRPKFIIDIASLTRETQYLMGTAATSVFTNDDNLWASVKAASIHTGDRVWRLPLWEAYDEQVALGHNGADLVNSPIGDHAYTAAAAAFLSHFICYNKWIHLDTTAVMIETGETTYLRKGMSGRPTRTIVEMMAMLACRPPEC
uniref:Cytosol aminopeptidase n=1 Tax=Lygus hesperus TaxID=30085 RepID=A0A0K8TJ51_LYGHE